MAVPNWNLTQVLNQLNSGSTWFGSQISYSFPTATTNMSTDDGEGGGFTPLSNVQITFAKYALASWDELIAPSFFQGTGKTDIEFGNTTTGIDYAHAYYPSDGTVWFNPDYDDLTNVVIGDYGYGTYIHEIGHALGLNHMGNYNGSGNWTPSSFQDTTVLSIMSYFGPDQGSDDGKNDVMWADWVKGGVTYAAQTPMLNDIMALQAMYGVDTTTRTGATVYGFHSNITGSAATFLDFDVNDNPILCIFDSSGNDTLDLSGFSTSSTISLVAGSFSNCNDMTNNISIAYTATIENAVGGSASDKITGNDVANILEGGRGNDTINGGDGSDIAVFSGLFANYTVVSNGTGAYTVTDNVGNDGTDTLSSIELLRFSDKDVTDGTSGGGDILGTADVDDLTGTTAGETIRALAGNDTVMAGDGDDTIYGGTGMDDLWGEAGADIFAYSSVKDSLFKDGKFDLLKDFSLTDGDRIDLSAVDGNTKSGHQHFKFAGDGDGWAKRGQLDFWIDGGQTYIYGNTDKDKAAEFFIQIDGVVNLTSTDFAL